MTSLLLWLCSLAWLPRLAFFFVQNVLVFAGALAFGEAIVAWAPPSRRVAPRPAPVERVELALAGATVALNALVTDAGFELDRVGLLAFRPGAGWRVALDVLVLTLAMDFAMYLLHRLAHAPPFARIHRLHHRYVAPRPLTLFVLHPLETIGFGALWLLVVRLVSPTWPGTLVFLTLNVFFGVHGHTGVELFPAWLARVPVLRAIAGGRFHVHHHEDERVNFGFYTTIWDRLFGTYRAPSVM